MTSAKDMSIEELRTQAASRPGADDDWGHGLVREAQQEIERRAQLIEKIQYPNGHPIPPVEDRIVKILNQYFTSTLRADSPIVAQLITEMKKK